MDQSGHTRHQTKHKKLIQHSQTRKHNTKPQTHDTHTRLNQRKQPTNHTNTHTNTINLSNTTLSNNDLKLLDLGLTFAPTSTRMKQDDIATALNKLTRTLKLKDFFEDDDMGHNYLNLKNMFRHPSTWEPKNKEITEPTWEVIFKLQERTTEILNDYELRDDHYYIKHKKHNLTQGQRDSIKTLRNNKNIVIKPADKGGMVCILNRTSYINEAHRQLNNTKYYTEIPEPLKQDLIPKINHILDRLYRTNYITSDQLKYLQANNDDRLRRFYLLPKIHKPREKWPQADMPEGRPIVSDCGSESKRISEYIDFFLAPLANKHPSYIKDTYDFIDKIRNKPINQDYILVTGDVTSLYTNMNIDRTLQVVTEAFNTHHSPLRPDREILELLELTLKNNDFSFNGQTYLQIFGTAMGKNFAPNCANLYLKEFDRRAVTDFHIQPLFFFRFLDDTFLLWPGTVQQLHEYETFLNTIIPDIKITLNYNHKEINFLDTTVFKYTIDNCTTLQTRVYFKETDTHQLLHTASFHPPHTFRGILKSQILRFKRLSSHKTDYDTACNTLFRALRHRGYNNRMLRKTKHTIWHKQDPTTTQNTIKDIIPITIQYNPISVRLTRAWKQLILQHEYLKHTRPIAAYYKNKNLRSLLTSSRL